MSENLKTTLAHLPHVKKVWVDKNGDYHFYNKPGFKEVDLTQVEEEEKQPVKQKAKK